ncbi:hypothetical protein COO60DRAFT_1547379 [Scenedesmus sp. NREL 46B-D3]|nr:hypothetical protein COO60DRAFT_1547379 [Scenedesmus sp. NREL 46B-D3]
MDGTLLPARWFPCTTHDACPRLSHLSRCIAWQQQQDRLMMPRLKESRSSAAAAADRAVSRAAWASAGQHCTVNFHSHWLCLWVPHGVLQVIEPSSSNRRGGLPWWCCVPRSWHNWFHRASCFKFKALPFTAVVRAVIRMSEVEQLNEPGSCRKVRRLILCVQNSALLTRGLCACRAPGHAGWLCAMQSVDFPLKQRSVLVHGSRLHCRVHGCITWQRQACDYWLAHGHGLYVCTCA